MKLFNERELRDAYDYSGKGGQALHMHQPGPYKNVPWVIYSSSNGTWVRALDDFAGRTKDGKKRFEYVGPGGR